MKYEEFKKLIPLFQNNEALKEKVDKLDSSVQMNNKLILFSDDVNGNIKLNLFPSDEIDKQIIENLFKLLNRKIEIIDEQIKSKMESEEE